MNLRHLFEELKRRHVFRVAGVYLVVAWAIVQVAATVFPLLNFSDAAATAVVIVAILGLPVVILLAWVFDVTPQGIQRTDALGEPLPVPLPDALERQRRRFAARAMGFVGVGILVALVGFAAYGRFGTGTGRQPTDDINSIAVLPFSDLSAARDQEYFTDGVTEELINRLAKVDGLRVTPRTSSFAFRDRKLDVFQIGDQLHVQAVLEGSVRRDGDNLRVTARLVDTRSGEAVWADTYDRKVSGLFAIQDDISGAIVDALRLQLGPQSPLMPADGGGTRNAAAQDLYFKGLKAWNERTDAQLQVALQYFEQAAEADTAFALAYAGLAKTYAVLPTVTDYSIADALRKGKAAAARALLLNPSLGEAHAALGQLAQNLEWDLTSALRSYRRAVNFNPKDATAHQWYAEALMLTGDLKSAGEQIAQALVIDQLSPAVRSVHAYQIMLAGDLTRADSVYQGIVREHPGYRVAALNYAFAALAARDYAGAAEGLILALPHYAPDMGALISAASAQGARTESLRAIAAIARTEPASVAILLYAAIGDHARALTALDEAFNAGQDANFPYILVHPLLQPLRSETKFQQILRTVGVTLPA